MYFIIYFLFCFYLTAVSGRRSGKMPRLYELVASSLVLLLLALGALGTLRVLRFYLRTLVLLMVGDRR
jgi:hypothetical protein